MKNFIKIVTLAVISIFIAVSCAPPVELSDFDWDAANADRSSAGNGGYNVTNYVPTYSVTEIENADKTIITDLEIEIEFKQDADILRKEITASSLSFLTFHTFEKSEEKYTADTLSAPLPFTVEQRNGDVITVKVPVNITKSSTYRNIIARIDGKKYTYAHGIRLDVDSNGKIENVYDDYYYSTITVAGASNTLFTAPGQKTTGVSLLGFNPTISTVPTAPSTPGLESFYFVDAAATTTSNLLLVAQLWYDSEFDKDIGGVIAGGIKLQKLNGTTWTDVKSAEFDETRRDNNGAELATGTYNFIVIKDVTFDHLGTYRIFWKGKAYTETTGTYYGVKQRISVNLTGSTPATGAARYTRTEIATATQTAVNNKVAQFISGSFGASVSLQITSFDSEGKNNVLKISIDKASTGDTQYYWNSVSLADFKKSFQIVYSLGGGASDNDSDDLVYVGIKDVKFAAEDWAAALGNNVLYITLDPAYKLNGVAAFNDYWNYVAAYSAWEAANQAYVTAYAAWQDEKDAYDSAVASATTQFYSDLSDWNDARDAWLANIDNNPDNDKTEQDYIDDGNPKPVIQDYLSAITVPNPGPYTGPASVGSEPTAVQESPLGIYFRINNGISITDKKTPETVQRFGNEDPFYDNFDFYGPL